MNQPKKQTPMLPGLSTEDFEQKLFDERCKTIEAQILLLELRLTKQLRGMQLVLPKELYASLKACVKKAIDGYLDELRETGSLDSLAEEQAIVERYRHLSEEREAA